MPATCYIELVTTDKDGKTTNTSLKQIKLSQNYATLDAVLALVGCLVLSMAVMIVTRGKIFLKFGSLPDNFKIGPPAWEFAKSWSSTLTLAGATVTAALALSVLPELTRNASKNGYSIIAFLIGVVVAVAPISFVIFRHGEVVPDEATKKGSVLYTGGLFAFFVSCNLSLFAGLAQLLVLFLLGDELFRDYGVWSWHLVGHEPWSLGVGSILIVFAALLCIHTVRSMLLTVKLELPNSVEGTLGTLMARAEQKKDDLNEVMNEMLTKPDEADKIATIKGAAEQAAGHLARADTIQKALRKSNNYVLSQQDQAALMKAAKDLGVDLKSAPPSRPPRSWPIL
jgi:hypothetical protein